MSVHATVEIVDDKQTFTGLFRTVVTALADPQGMFPPSFSFEGTVEGHRVSVAGF